MDFYACSSNRSSTESSPLSSLASSTIGSPAPEFCSQADSTMSEERPAKRRRVSGEPKPRTTKHLDLRPEILPADQTEHLDKLMKLLQNRRKIVVVAGAGISVSAGSKF
jgi:NAD-dependent histone deacetylase SIR2